MNKLLVDATPFVYVLMPANDPAAIERGIGIVVRIGDEATFTPREDIDDWSPEAFDALLAKKEP